MRQPVADKALLAAVGELRSFPTDDVAAILDILESSERALIQRLLDAHTALARAAALTKADFEAAGISPWLVQHMDSGDAAMTSHARQVLGASILELMAPAEAMTVPAVQAAPSLLGLIASRLSWRKKKP